MGPYFGCWGSLLGSYFTKNGSLLGPYLKAWGSLLVLEAVGVFLTLDKDYVCDETENRKKSHFYPISRIPNSSLLSAAALPPNGRIVV